MESGRVRVGGKYIIKKKIGAGSFGDVFIGQNAETNEDVAIKLEDANSKFPQVLAEAKVMSLLKGPGFSKIH